jgi:hypothetical protein
VAEGHKSIQPVGLLGKSPLALSIIFEAIGITSIKTSRW